MPFVKPIMLQITIWRISITCGIPKSTNTHSEYVILFHYNNGYTLYMHCLSGYFM